MKDTSLNNDTDNADVLGKDALEANRNRPINAWDVLGSLIGQVEGPEDWSEQHDHYLYGTPGFAPKVRFEPKVGKLNQKS